MKSWTLILGLAVALVAGCDRPPQPAASGSAASGASGAPQTGPKGDRVELPPSSSATSSGRTEPDPGDANDHSTPQHDARQKTDSGQSHD